jgi:hypothetical protein
MLESSLTHDSDVSSLHDDRRFSLLDENHVVKLFALLLEELSIVEGININLSLLSAVDTFRCLVAYHKTAENS